MDQAAYQLVDIIVGTMSVLTTAIIAWILFTTGKKSEKQKYLDDLKNLWTQIDAAVLAKDELLVEADRLIHPDRTEDTIEAKRRRWICYMLQNAIAITHTGISKKLFPDTQSVQNSLHKTLSALAKNKEYKQVAEYCHETNLKVTVDSI